VLESKTHCPKPGFELEFQMRQNQPRLKPIERTASMQTMTMNCALEISEESLLEKVSQILKEIAKSDDSEKNSTSTFCIFW
jgi:hypothetical protein